MNLNHLNKDEVYVRLVKVVEGVLQVFREKDLKLRPKIELQSDIYADLAIDSLEMMDIMTALEKEFEISLEIEQLISKRKIKEVVDLISDKLSAKKYE